MDSAFLGIGLLPVKDERMADHADFGRIRVRDEFRRQRFLLLLLFEADEPDLDQLMPQEPVADRPDYSLHEPFLSDQDNRLAIVGYTSKICFLKSLQFRHSFLPLFSDWASGVSLAHGTAGYKPACAAVPPGICENFMQPTVLFWPGSSPENPSLWLACSVPKALFHSIRTTSDLQTVPLGISFRHQQLPAK
jgi:hypothetical protein